MRYLLLILRQRGKGKPDKLFYDVKGVDKPKDALAVVDAGGGMYLGVRAARALKLTAVEADAVQVSALAFTWAVAE